MLVSVNKLSGQQAAQFLTEKEPLSTTLNESESNRWQTFSQKATTQSISLVEIGSLTALLSTGKLTFSIPNGPQNLQAEGSFIKEEANGDYVWWANLTDQTGYIGVAKNSTGQFVAIQKGTDYYQFHPLSSRYNAMVKTNTNVPSSEMCSPLIESPANITTDPTNCDIMGNCKAVVSVLVLITPEALNSLGFAPNSIDAALYIPFGLHSINFALVNSGVFGKSFRFIVEGYNFNFSNDLDMSIDLLRLQNDQAAFDRRTANKADLMVLLTDDRYGNGLGIWRIYTTGASVFGMVSIENLFGVKNVFAHELGHAFSLNHSREEENYYNHDVCAFGWRLLDQDFAEHKTIMTTGQPGGPPYVYAWYKSNTGFFNPLNGSNNQMPEYLGNTPSISLFVDATTWLKVDVCGQGVCANHVIKIENCDGEPQERLLERNNALAKQMEQTYKIVPNPVLDALQLKFNAPLNGLVTYSITNSLGQLMLSNALNSSNFSTIDISFAGKNFPPGMYYCSVLNESIAKTLPFSIIR